MNGFASTRLRRLTASSHPSSRNSSCIFCLPCFNKQAQWLTSPTHIQFLYYPMPFLHPLNLKHWNMTEFFLSSFLTFFSLKFVIKNLNSRRVKIIEFLSSCIDTEQTETTIIVLPTGFYLLEVVFLIHNNGFFLAVVVNR